MTHAARCLMVIATLHGLALAASAADDFEFFEKKIRPALVQHCYKCHSSETSEAKGGLRLDSREAIRKGGESGPAVVPGKPDESLLLDALAHDDSFVNMPPTGKLPVAVIEDLRQWIAAGAPDPRDQPSGAKLDWQQVLEGRKGWWSFQPIRKPSLPQVRDASWSSRPIDRFLQAKWEAAGIEPAPAADLRTLIRRVSLVLTGLPPTVEEVEAFVSTRNYTSLVDRLLASPRFGERFARHWMDLVRYGETHGSEHDPLVPHAWRYRDYIIRAFNDDLPYDRFLHEQLAGDLLPPRWNHTLGINESLVGTMFYRMVEFYPTPIDAKNEEISVVESQIDSFGKTFQGLTHSCARCHDHKFDPISAADFYALYGIFASTRTTMHRLDDQSPHHIHDSALQELRRKIRNELVGLWSKELSRWPLRVALARERLSKSPPVEKLEDDTSEVDRDAYVLHHAASQRSSPLYPLGQIVKAQGAATPPDVQTVWSDLVKAYWDYQNEYSFRNQKRFTLFADFTRGEVGSWYMSDRAFQAATPGTIVIAPTGDKLLTGVYPSGLYTHLLSDKQGGTLRSPNFTLDMTAVSALVCGTNNARLRLVVENFQGDEVLYTRSNPKLKEGDLHWETIVVRPQWKGRRAYLEVIPRDDMTYVGKVGDASKLPTDGRSGVGIRYVVFHNNPQPPAMPTLERDQLLQDIPFGQPIVAYVEREGRLIRDLQEQVGTALKVWGLVSSESPDKLAEPLRSHVMSPPLSDSDALLLDTLLRAGYLSNRAPDGSALQRLVNEYRALEAEIPVSPRAPGVADEDGNDERLFSRGDYRFAGDPIERRYLEVLHSRAYMPRGSGRLQLAQELASPSNPLTARVMVNRVWQHIFGAGLVRSVDNFGALGETPSHPELLDWLAVNFVEQGWSVKQLIRELLLSRAFQLSAQSSPAADERDPENRLWSHASLRRLEAEAIRDSLLFVSGRLDETMYGLGVPLPVNQAYKDFDVPVSGPLDGNGRRSVYLEVRRNHPLGLLMAFDQPRPMSTTGRRDVTNVPAQSLTMLNDPFVRQQANRLADRLLADPSQSDVKRVANLYQLTLSRPPTAVESRRALQFLGQQQTALEGISDPGHSPSTAAWRDLAHAVMNLKEFIYVK